MGHLKPLDEPPEKLTLASGSMNTTKSNAGFSASGGPPTVVSASTALSGPAEVSQGQSIGSQAVGSTSASVQRSYMDSVPKQPPSASSMPGACDHISEL